MVMMYLLLQHAPPTTDDMSVLKAMYIPIPKPRSMHANLQARATSLCSTHGVYGDHRRTSKTSHSRFSFPFQAHAIANLQAHAVGSVKRAHARGWFEALCTVSMPGNKLNILPARTKNGPYTCCHYGTMIASS